MKQYLHRRSQLIPFQVHFFIIDNLLSFSFNLLIAIFLSLRRSDKFGATGNSSLICGRYASLPRLLIILDLSQFLINIFKNLPINHYLYKGYITLILIFSNFASFGRFSENNSPQNYQKTASLLNSRNLIPVKRKIVESRKSSLWFAL